MGADCKGSAKCAQPLFSISHLRLKTDDSTALRSPQSAAHHASQINLPLLRAPPVLPALLLYPAHASSICKSYITCLICPTSLLFPAVRSLSPLAAINSLPGSILPRY